MDTCYHRQKNHTFSWGLLRFCWLFDHHANQRLRHRHLSSIQVCKILIGSKKGKKKQKREKKLKKKKKKEEANNKQTKLEEGLSIEEGEIEIRF